MKRGLAGMSPAKRKMIAKKGQAAMRKKLAKQAELTTTINRLNIHTTTTEETTTNGTTI